MFQYGIDTTNFIISIVSAIGLGIPMSLVFDALIADGKANGKKIKIIQSCLNLFIIVFMFGLLFIKCQRDYCCEQAVKTVLNKNYPGYTDFENVDYNCNEENSFIYKKAKYTWEYDRSNKKLTVTYYGVPREDAVFIDGKKQEKETK